MSVHAASMKGKRDRNEDHHTVILNIDGKDTTKCAMNYYGVYDGHGGKFVSKFISDQLPICFTDKRLQYPIEKKLVKKIYNHIQHVLKESYHKNSSETGSTCLIAIHFKKDNCEYLNILNTGDCRCVISKNNMATPLTKDHKPNWPEEALRIKNLGGQIAFDGYDWRIGDLSVSRAFGDTNAAPYLTCMPDMFSYKLKKNDQFMILACDGLWDVLSCQDAVNFILENGYDQNTKKSSSHNIAKKLAEHAIAKGSTDNVTIIVVFFK